MKLVCCCDMGGSKDWDPPVMWGRGTSGVLAVKSVALEGFLVPTPGAKCFAVSRAKRRAFGCFSKNWAIAMAFSLCCLAKSALRSIGWSWAKERRCRDLTKPSPSILYKQVSRGKKNGTCRCLIPPAERPLHVTCEAHARWRMLDCDEHPDRIAVPHSEMHRLALGGNLHICSR